MLIKSLSRYYDFSCPHVDPSRLHHPAEDDQPNQRRKYAPLQDVIQCFIRGLRPELEIRVKRKESFKEVFNDTINVERDLAASSALRVNENSDYLKMDDYK